eukprot:Gb_10231 [translate_table: standard]
MKTCWELVSLKVLILILLGSKFYNAQAWNWFSSSDTDIDDPAGGRINHEYDSNSVGNGFDIEAVDNAKGKQLVENARNKLASSYQDNAISYSCWQKAYSQLFSSCKEIMQDEEKKSRLAWYMTECFQKESGRRPLPYCPASTLMINCLKQLNDAAHKVYLAFFIDTNAMCHHLQSHAFKQDTERVVNELKLSAHWVVDKMGKIEEQSDSLLEHSNQIYDSLNSIDSQAQVVIQKSQIVEDKITNVMDQSKAIFEQSYQIVDAQSKLREEQLHMQKTLDSSLADLQNSYVSLGEGIGFLQKITTETQNQITEVGDAMSSKLENLQTKADDIGNVVAMSLDQQKKLLDGQSLALQGLDNLTQFQAEAFEESRLSLQRLADGARQQQLEFMSYQEELQQTHSRLAHSSATILAAQEAFETKQTTIFMALDKLFSLHNAILLESRAIKTFFFYSIMICVLYMLTSTKQTSSVRAPLYFGLCMTFAIEFLLVRLKGNDLSQQGWIASKTFYVRTAFISIVILHLLASLIRYRDYEVLNYRMLLDIQGKLNSLESILDENQAAVYHKGPNLAEMDSKAKQHHYARRIIKKAASFQRQRSMISGLRTYPHISLVDANLEEDDSSDDPDYEPPLNSRENFAIISKTYNLRSHSHS